MLLKPLTNTGHCSLIKVRTGVWTVKDANLSEEEYCNPATFTL
jgi:hypothetical protein